MPHDPSPLVGRASVLADVTRRAREGSGSVLTAPPGSGGTRLLQDVVQSLRRTALRVPLLQLTRDAVRPSPLIALLDRSVVDALPAGDRAALRSAVLALGLDGLAIEDAHLLDEATGAIVVDLARSGVAVVANATGPGGMPDALRLLLAEQRAVAVPLPPLTHDEVVELAEHLLGEPVDGNLTQALVAASDGRPGTLTEVVEDGVGARAIVHVDGLWRLAAPLPSPRSVRTAVLDAFLALPPDQRGWIAAVAIAGTIADDLTPRIAAPATIAAAADAGWTTRNPECGGMRITSIPVATAVVGSLDMRARRTVLRRLVGATAAVGRPLREEERVALALWRIELGDAVDALEAHALALLPGTTAEARESLLRAAVDGGAPAGAALAEHLRHTRRPAEALRVIGAALPDAASDGERTALLRVRSMTTGVIERRSAEALAALDEHLAGAGPHADLLAVRAGLLLLEGRLREAVETAEAALVRSGSTGFAAAFALLQRALGLRELGELHRSLATAAELRAFPDVERAFPQGTALADWLPAEIAVAVAIDLDTAEDALTAALDSVPASLLTARRPPIAYTTAGIRMHRGDPAGAVRLLREADGGSGGWRDGWQPRILAELTIAQALSGALQDAAATHDRLLRTTCPPIQRCRVELATAQLDATRGDLDAAVARVAAAAERGVRAGLVLDAFDATFAGIRYGDPTAAQRLLDLGPRPAGSGRAAQRTYAAALVSENPVAVDAAAVGLWDAGLRLHALEAAARAVDLGAPDALRRLVAWRTRTPTLRLPDVTDRRGGGLTAREREVALLAAAGASDRSIATELGITLRTAQTHLGRALAKLGIHRRTDLPSLVGEP